MAVRTYNFNVPGKKDKEKFMRNIHNKSKELECLSVEGPLPLADRKSNTYNLISE